MRECWGMGEASQCPRPWPSRHEPEEGRDHAVLVSNQKPPISSKSESRVTDRAELSPCISSPRQALKRTNLNNGYPPEQVVPALNLTPDQTRRVCSDIDTKRNTTRYLHLRPQLVGPVPEETYYPTYSINSADSKHPSTSLTNKYCHKTNNFQHPESVQE